MDDALATPPVDRRDGDLLLDIADRAVVDGLSNLDAQPLDASRLPAALRAPIASFVTLQVRGELNGCIGSIRPGDPLAVDVARHARSAAFDDPRLPPLTWIDYQHLHIDISVLSELVPVPARSRTELLDSLRPGIDGLLITAGKNQAVFLPAVWEQLPTADEFLDQLFRKAELAPTAWPEQLRAFGFTAHKISR